MYGNHLHECISHVLRGIISEEKSDIISLYYPLCPLNQGSLIFRDKFLDQLDIPAYGVVTISITVYSLYGLQIKIEMQRGCGTEKGGSV